MHLEIMILWLTTPRTQRVLSQKNRGCINSRKLRYDAMTDPSLLGRVLACAGAELGAHAPISIIDSGSYTHRPAAVQPRTRVLETIGQSNHSGKFRQTLNFLYSTTLF